MSIRVSQNTEVAKDVVQALKANNGYCPCKIEKTPDTQCPCLEFREMEEGECHCGLFIKTVDSKKYL